jgi:hypothetical protein
MKNMRITRIDDGTCYDLSDEKVITFQVRNIQIDCRQGVIWVTWPDGNERMLKKGQSVTVASKGLICVQAFASSTIVVRKMETEISRRFVPCRPAALPLR